MTNMEGCRNVALYEPCRSQLHSGRPCNCVTSLQVAVACHVPKALADEKELGVKEWFETVTKAMQGEVEVKEESEEVMIALVHASKEKELFALKMRDAGSSAGYQMLLKKGLIPQDGARNLQCDRTSRVCTPLYTLLGAVRLQVSVNRTCRSESMCADVALLACAPNWGLCSNWLDLFADSDDDFVPDPEALGIDPW